MKKPHVLNRAMFNRGGTSAYGRGITSNLVTEEQRQRFNYGGRVRAKDGFYTGPIGPETFYGGTDFYAPIRSPSINYKNFGIGIGSGRGAQDYLVEDDIIEEESTPYKGWASRNIDYKDLAVKEHLKENKAKRDALEKALLGAQEDEMIATTPDPSDKIIPPPGNDSIMADSDTMDWESILGPTKGQKAATTGKTQLATAAGVLDAFSQPTLSKGMQAGSKHLLNIGKTATAAQDERDKAILQGKVLEKVYKTKAGEAGKWAVAAEKIKQGILNSDNAIYNAAAQKGGPTEGLEAVVKFDITSAPTKDGELDVEAFTARGEGQIAKLGGQFILTVEDGKILGPADADDIKDAYAAWKARKKLASSPTS